MKSPTLLGVPVPDKPKAFRVATRARDRREFVEGFWRFADETSIFLAIKDPPALGRRQPFRITLADGSPLMSGEGEVVECVRDRAGRFGMNGMRVRFLRIDEATREIHRELLSRRLQASPHPRPISALPGGTHFPGEANATATDARPPETAEALPPAPETALATPLAGTLPANPLADVSAASLEHFVECEINEDFGVGLAELAAMQPLVPVPAPPVLPAHMVRPPAAAVPAPTRPSRPMTVDPDQVVEVNELTPPPLPEPPLRIEPRPLTPISGEPSSLMPKGWNTGEVPTFAPEYAPEQRKVWPLVSAVSAGTLVLGLLLGYLIWGGDEPRTAVAEAAPAAAAPVAPAAMPVAAPRPPPGCTATITSDPPGSKVSIAGKSLGATPLQGVSLPCTGTLVFDRPRYARVEQPISLTAGEPGTLAATLSRAEAALQVVTTPPGAQVTVNGQAAGKSPVSIKVSAFTKVAVSAAMPGYKPWSQKVYVKGKKQAVTARLEPIAKARPPARPSKKPATSSR